MIIKSVEMLVQIAYASGHGQEAAPDTNPGLASLLVATIALVIAYLSFRRSAPSIFVVGPFKATRVRQGKLAPERFTFEIHNKGASGITISAIGIVSKGTTVAHHSHDLGRVQYPNYLDAKAPIRIDPYDTKVVVLNVWKYQHYVSPQPQPLEFRIEWYGSLRWWRYFRRPVGKGGTWIRTKQQLRLRHRRVSFDLGTD